MLVVNEAANLAILVKDREAESRSPCVQIRVSFRDLVIALSGENFRENVVYHFFLVAKSLVQQAFCEKVV